VRWRVWCTSGLPHDEASAAVLVSRYTGHSGAAAEAETKNKETPGRKRRGLRGIRD